MTDSHHVNHMEAFHAERPALHASMQKASPQPPIVRVFPMRHASEPVEPRPRPTLGRFLAA